MHSYIWSCLATKQRVGPFRSILFSQIEIVLFFSRVLTKGWCFTSPAIWAPWIGAACIEFVLPLSYDPFPKANMATCLFAPVTKPLGLVDTFWNLFTFEEQVCLVLVLGLNMWHGMSFLDLNYLFPCSCACWCKLKLGQGVGLPRPELWILWQDWDCQNERVWGSRSWLKVALLAWKSAPPERLAGCSYCVMIRAEKESCPLLLFNYCSPCVW